MALRTPARSAPSPFSAVTLQEKPLFDDRSAHLSLGRAKLQALFDCAGGSGSGLKTGGTVLDAASKVAATPARLSSSATVPVDTPLFSAYRPSRQVEELEEEFGELRTQESTASAYSYELMLEAVSIAPKDAATIPNFDCDSPCLGFWADVGTSIVGQGTAECGALAETASDLSDWEAGSDSDEEEEECLLPWDM